MSCNWPVVSLQEISSRIGDGLHGTPKYDETGEYFFINGNNLSNGKILITDKTKRASQVEFEKHKKELTDRSILVSINGTLGNVALYDGENVFLGKSACYLNVKPNVNKLYIRYVLESSHFQNYIHSLATGSTIKNVSLKLIRDYTFKLPPANVQEKVSNTLASLDAQIDINRQINQTLEQIAQAIFKSWFVDFEPVKAKINALAAGGSEEDALLAAMQAISGKNKAQLTRLQTDNPEHYNQLRTTAELFPSAMQDSELGEIPEGWEVKKLSEMVELIGGGTPKKSEPSFWNGHICWFSVRDVPESGNIFVIDTLEKITDDGLQRSSTKLLPIGTTIITARGTVGKLALTGTPTAMNQSCYGVISSDESGPYFNYLRLCKAVETLQRNTHGAVFDTITRSTFETVSQPNPGISLRKQFETFVRPQFERIKSNVAQVKILSELRDSMLPKLLSGDIGIDESLKGRKVLG